MKSMKNIGGGSGDISSGGGSGCIHGEGLGLEGAGLCAHGGGSGG